MANRRFIDFPIAASVGDNDIVLIWQDGMNKQTTKGTLIQGAPTSLEGLTDVDIAGLINGQILQYNSTLGKWENVDRTDINLSELGDVSIVSPTNGQVLVYNSSTSKWENSSGGFVPYTGAVTTVDLGAQGLRAGYIRFDTSVVSVPDEQGLVYWDQSRSTAALIMNGVLQHIGQDVFYYVKNSTGSSIAKGTSVRFDGTDGASGHVKIAPFLANGTYPSNYFVGVTAETIANGAFGQVMHFGELDGINTSGYTAGALLYASTTTAGGFQTTAPVAPNNIVLIAAAINSKNNGTILVRPTYGSNINQDEGVKITTPTTGDLLQLQAGGLWENKTVAQVIGSAYVPSTRTITINGTTQDLSANRTFNVGTVTSVGLSSATSGVTIGSTPVTGSGTITIAIATASGSQNGLLSSTDWTTFNNKQNALTNPVTGTGTTNYLAKFTGASTIGNSNIQDSGSQVTIGTGLYINAGTNTNVGNGIHAYYESNFAQVQLNGSTGSLIDFSTSGTDFLGRIIYTNSSNSMQFHTNSGATAAMTLNSSGNLGLGVTPSAWGSLFNNSLVQVKTTSILGFDNNLYLGVNYYATNSSDNYIQNGFASRYVQRIGQHQWETAASGTANNSLTFTQAMTLTSGGNLLVGTTTDAGFKLDVNGTGRFTPVNTTAYVNSNTLTSGTSLYILNNAVTNNTASTIRLDAVGGDGSLAAASISSVWTASSSSDLTFGTRIGGSNVTERMRITSGGDVLIGTSTSFNHNGFGRFVNIRGGTNSVLYIGRSDAEANALQIGWTSSESYLYNITNTAFLFGTNNTERMRITSGGNVLINTTTSGASKLRIVGLPTSAAGLSSGDVWNDSGTLKIA
jgi:hypothetical protein